MHWDTGHMPPKETQGPFLLLMTIPLHTYAYILYFIGVGTRKGPILGIMDIKYVELILDTPSGPPPPSHPTPPILLPSLLFCKGQFAYGEGRGCGRKGEWIDIGRGLQRLWYWSL